MATLEEMKKELIPDYQKKFDELESIMFKLNSLGETEIAMQIVRKMAGLRMLIDHCEGKDDLCKSKK